jgi:phosphoribosyl 1,2-cyclic phosphodiesterase
MRFTVLASGSSGNASLLEVGRFGLLIDIGLGPRQLAQRLAHVRRSWDDIHAVLLTHTHGDHWNARTLQHVARKGIAFWCHPDHRRVLRCPAFASMCAERRAFHFEPDQPLEIGPGLSCRPIRVAHDEPTFGFRFEGRADLFEPLVLGYAADLGSWSADLARTLADAEVLALEFNHDVDLELHSGRSRHLIRRVLGSHGHLSNDQAGELVRAILRQSMPGRLRHLILLHLSRQCNRRHLAETAARGALGSHEAEIHTARQDRPLRPIGLADHKARAVKARARLSARRVPEVQPCFPGFDPVGPVGQA